MEKQIFSNKPQTSSGIRILRIKILRDPDRIIGVVDLEANGFVLRDFRLIRQAGIPDIVFWPMKQVQGNTPDKKKILEVVSANSWLTKQRVEAAVRKGLDDQLREESIR